MEKVLQIGRTVIVDAELHLALINALTNFVETHRSEIMYICQSTAPREKLAKEDLSLSEYENICGNCLSQAAHAL